MCGLFVALHNRKLQIIGNGVLTRDGSGDRLLPMPHRTPPTPGDGARETRMSYYEYDLDEVAVAVAEHMVKQDEVGELVYELYDAASDTLNALGAIRRPSYAVVTLMQRLRLVIKQVETEGEQQIADRHAASLEMRAHYAETAREAAL